jgi:PAS domain S-box-containing protein
VRGIVEPLLNAVLETGTAFHAAELSVMLNRHGKDEPAYFNLVYHPLKEENNEIAGIMVVATEVTESVRGKQALAESEKQFRNLVMQSPIPMTIFRGQDFIVEMANKIMFENIWRKKPEEVLGKSIFKVFPELRNQKYPELLNTVYATGKSYTEKESIAHVQGNDGLKTFYLDFEYAPLFDTENKPSGLIVTVNDVTSRVEARLKVEENEKRLSIVIDSSELGTWEWDLVTDEMTYSKRHLQIFNYADDESMVHHKNHLTHIHPDDQLKRERAMEDALATGMLSYESRIVWADGSVHWIEAKGKVFYDDARKPAKIIGTIRDITNEKNRQQELFENEQRFRLLADSMPQHIWTADSGGNLNYYNKSVFDYSGLTPEEIAEKGWLEIVHPEDRETNVKEWTEAVTTGNDFLFEHRFRRHDGQYRWQLSRALPQKDADGKIQMWVGTSTDIEDQKMFTTELEKQVYQRTQELLHLNETLAQSEQRYHLMVEEVEDYAILYLNREGIVENWNKGAEKIKGYLAEEIIGKSFSIFYPEQERKNHLPEQLLAEATKKGKAIHEGFRVRKDGSLFWASVAITAVHNEKGDVIGFSKVTHDLTEKKAADDKLKQNAAQLAQKNKDLEKMNVELQSFAYVSSHDLQEPLRKIQTFASRILAKEMQTLSDNGKDYFKRMQDAAGRMQTLIQDLLAYSRTSTTDRTFEKTDLAKIAEEVRLDIKETNPEKNALIEFGKLGEANVIPFQFRQLLYNLIGNAIKFAKPGVPPHIVINSETVKGSDVGTEKLNPQTSYCHISVTDNGIGFDPQYRNRIFEVFQRLHGKDEYSGTGIGLAIVKKIIDNHNGAISATGEVNRGARFDIYLPV